MKLDDSFDFDVPEDDFVDADDGRPQNAEMSDDEDPETVSRTRKALIGLTQRTQRGGFVPPEDTGECVQPANAFQEILQEEQVEVRRDENYATYLYINPRTNYASIAQKLELRFNNSETRKDFFRAFDAALADRSSLKLYLSPMVSAVGPQEPILRTLLTLNGSQKYVLQQLLLLIEDISTKGNDEKDTNELALACIAQFRYLEKIYEPRDVWGLVFDMRCERWHPAPRDAFIEMLPELLPDSELHNDAAKMLLDVIDADTVKSPLTMHVAILKTLTLLRLDAEMASTARRKLCERAGRLRGKALPHLLTFALETLDTDTKSTLSNVIEELGEGVQIDKIYIGRDDTASGDRSIRAEDIVLELCAIVCRYMRTHGNKAWRQLSTYFRNDDAPSAGARRADGSDDEHDDAADEDADERGDARRGRPRGERGGGERGQEVQLFGVVISFALMSIEHCPSFVGAHLRNEMATDRSDSLVKAVTAALGLKKFCAAYIASLFDFAQACLFSAQTSVKFLGAIVYREIFIRCPKEQEECMRRMLKHMFKSDGEAFAILYTLEELIDKHCDLVSNYTEKLIECLKSLDLLAVESVKHLYRVLVALYMTDVTGNLKKRVHDATSGYKNSINDSEKVWYLFGLLMEFEAVLENEGAQPMRASQREKAVTSLLKDMEALTTSAWLRSVFYHEMVFILRSCIRRPASKALLSWTGALLDTFRNDFFIERPANYDSCHDLEVEKYVVKQFTLWLSPDRERMIELGPLFELLKEAALVKQRWGQDDDTQQAIENHWNIFVFAFEANIRFDDISLSMSESDEVMTKSLNVLLHTINWIRALFNTFSCRDSIAGLSPETVKQLWHTKFLLMLECQRTIHQHIKVMREWPLPTLSAYQGTLIVRNEVKPAVIKKRKRAAKKKAMKNKRKRRNRNEEEDEDGNEEANEDVNENGEDREEDDEERDNSERGDENDEENNDDGDSRDADDEANKKAVEAVARVTLIPLKTLWEYFQPLKLAAIAQLITMPTHTRGTRKYIFKRFLDLIEKLLPKRERQAVPWERKIAANNGKPVMPADFHGDSATIWKCVMKSIPSVWVMADSARTFFSEQFETSLIGNNQEKQTEFASLFCVSLRILATLMSCKEINETTKADDRNAHARYDRRRKFMELLEHTHLAKHTDEVESDDAELTIYKFLVKCASVVPRADVAVALLDATAAIELFDDECRRILARRSLGYLKQEWSDEHGKELKGTALITAVRSMLQHYLRLRNEESRLEAIQWLLAAKITALMPDSDQKESHIAKHARKSMSGRRRGDDENEEQPEPIEREADERTRFFCLTKETFTVVYRILFTTLNNTIAKTLVHQDSVRNGAVTLNQCTRQWFLASSCFCILSLMLRAANLRNSSVLTTAAREGKRFLTLTSKNSSFIYVIENQTRQKQQEATNIVAVVNFAKVGNRTLQLIGVYAKEHRSVALLRAMPELRAASEVWVRAMQHAHAKAGCLDAFEIGVMKGRNIDGEQINERNASLLEEDEENDDDDGSSSRGGGGDDGDDSNDGTSEASHHSDVF